MAVVNCPECGGKVSQTLETCPHCGFRLDLEIRAEGASPPLSTVNVGERVVNSFHQCFPRSDRLHVEPQIPDEIRRGARHYFYLQPDENLIAIYDETVFGSGKNGFSLTTKRIYWKNLGEEGQIREYASLVGPFFIESSPNRIQVGPDLAISIFLMDEKIGEGCVDFLGKACLAYTEGPPVETMDGGTKFDRGCKSCGASNESADASCEYCGASLETTFEREDSTNDKVAPEYYSEVALELEQNTVHRGLWLWARSEAKGDKGRAEIFYTRARINELKVAKTREYERLSAEAEAHEAERLGEEARALEVTRLAVEAEALEVERLATEKRDAERLLVEERTQAQERARRKNDEKQKLARAVQRRKDRRRGRR